MTVSRNSWFLLAVVALACLTACAIADSQHVASDLQNSNFEVAQRSLQQYDDEQYAEDYFGDIGDFDPGQDIDLIDDETPQKGASPASDSKAAGTPAKVSKSKRTKKETTKNKIIEFAPEAEVKWGDDIDDEGKCEKEIEKYCDDVEEGEGQLADCISDAISESEDADENDDVPEISDECREEMYQYKIARNANINANIPLAKACKLDADKFCNVTWFFGYKSGQVISCLRDVKNQVTKKCKDQLFKIQMDGARDMRADPMLWEACREDADNVCKDVKPGGGRIQSCLRDKRMQLSWACEEQLFRQEMENADDIRLSVRLFSKCRPDKRKFCKDIEPGGARAKDCLEEHRKDLSTACREEVDGMIERRVRDFRLDSKLRSACENEIFNMCAYFGDLDDIDTYDSSVVNCLQDYSAEIKNAECKRQVKKYVVLASQDIRFDVPLAEACFEDRQKFCAGVPPGSARVIRCLTTQRPRLSPVCRATLFDEEVRFSENIDFQYPMKEACKSELQRFCKDVPHGNARAIRCLQDNKKERDFGKACKEEVEAYEQEISKDYRLNFRLKQNCAKDVQALCGSVCAESDGNVCGGKVLRCLTDKMNDIKVEACRKEVFYFQKMNVENFKNDIILAEACRADVDKFCAGVEPGEGRVHKCLRDNRKKLSEQCRVEELRLEQKESENIELNVNLLKACRAERQLFCSDVQPGSARVFRCLAENMNDADFSNTCKYQIVYKLQRRQSNWKLDPPLRKACREDVTQHCPAEDNQNSEEGLVYRCLIAKVADISSGCQKELGRAVHMAFYVWQPGAIITADCDSDITNLCLTQRPNMAQRPGAVGTCLASILERQEGTSRRSVAETPAKEAKEAKAPAKEAKEEKAPAKEAKEEKAPAKEAKEEKAPAKEAKEEKEAKESKKAKEVEETAVAPNPGALINAKLSDKCYVLADIAQPPDMRKAFEASLSFALLKSQLDKLDALTGIPLVTRDRRGAPQAVSLTGWMAMLGMTAMVGLIVYAAFIVYRRMRGIPDKDYTLVVKQGGHK